MLPSNSTKGAKSPTDLERREMGGVEDNEGLLKSLSLGILLAPLARRQLRVINDSQFLDPAEVHFLCWAVVNYMEALDGIAACRTFGWPAETDLGSDGAGDLESRQHRRS